MTSNDFRDAILGAVSPHLLVGKTFARFCIV